MTAAVANNSKDKSDKAVQHVRNDEHGQAQHIHWTIARVRACSVVAQEPHISYHKPPKEDVIRMILYGFNHAPGFREQMVSEISKINILGKLRDSKIPTLIVEGKWDFLWGNMDRVEVMRKNHPRAQIEVFEKSGHMIFADEPEKFFSMLRDFLKKQVATPLSPTPRHDNVDRQILGYLLFQP